MALSHSSPVLGIPVAWEVLSGEVHTWRIPTFIEFPLNFSAKSCDTCLWWPFNLWKNWMHPTLVKTSKKLGSSMINFGLIGLYLNCMPPLFVFFGVAFSFVLQRWPSSNIHTYSVNTWWKKSIMAIEGRYDSGILEEEQWQWAALVATYKNEGESVRNKG